MILCYFLYIPYPINYCKNIQNIKNCLLLQTPPTKGGVWCDTPAVKSSKNHCSPDGVIGMRSINTEVPAFGDSLSWDTNLCVCDITTEVSLLASTDLRRLKIHFAGRGTVHLVDLLVITLWLRTCGDAFVVLFGWFDGLQCLAFQGGQCQAGQMTSRHHGRKPVDAFWNEMKVQFWAFQVSFICSWSKIMLKKVHVQIKHPVLVSKNIILGLLFLPVSFQKI